MTLQAVNLDGDMMQKVNMLLSGIFGAGTDKKAPVKQPQGRVQEMTDLRSMGFKVLREK